MAEPHYTPVLDCDRLIPEHARIAMPLEQQHYLCGGEIKHWSGPREDVFSPLCEESDGTVRRCRIGSYPLLPEDVALEVLDVAAKAYDHGRGVWPTLSVGERIAHVQGFARQMETRREDVVRLLMWEIGKTRPDAEKEFDRTVQYIIATIDALKDLDRVGSRFVIEQSIAAQIRRAPLGVVLCMGPYNYPLNETFTTLIPALIMGNVVIFKPPKLGVLLHEPLLDAFRDAFPPGVINTVYGEGQEVVGPLMKSGRIDVLAFIGSSRVADLLKHQHPKPHRLRCVLGLEAKNAAIVLPDADLSETVDECVLGSLNFNGQRCTALKILFVHADIVDDFIHGFVAAVERLKAGMPWEAGVQLTALPEPNKTQYLKELINDALAQGGRLINPTGGTVRHTFMTPAVIYPVRPGMRLYTEEQFGPVVPIVPFTDLETPLDYLTQSNYGQQVSLFSHNPEQLAQLIDPLVNQVCRVNINSQCQRGPDSFPFTGRKDSAEGTLSVSDALRVFSIRTLVAAKQTEANRELIQSIVTERKSRFLATDFIL
ncbi:MAG: NADP-dependent glyceraldehyde-3-phosphate dehydrogenase [Pseudomonadota bacterium]|nr:NADP-dependent glyceraldehyde-3-phosphate dehydrogenase [Pseudomonadota bacterium]